MIKISSQAVTSEAEVAAISMAAGAAVAADEVTLEAAGVTLEAAAVTSEAVAEVEERSRTAAAAEVAADTATEAAAGAVGAATSNGSESDVPFFCTVSVVINAPNCTV